MKLHINQTLIILNEKFFKVRADRNLRMKSNVKRNITHFDKYNFQQFFFLNNAFYNL